MVTKDIRWSRATKNITMESMSNQRKYIHLEWEQDMAGPRQPRCIVLPWIPKASWCHIHQVTGFATVLKGHTIGQLAGAES
jgi:hypothetical protein